MKKRQSILTGRTQERLTTEIDETLEWMIAVGMMDVRMRDGKEYTSLRPAYLRLSAKKFGKVFESKMRMFWTIRKYIDKEMAQGHNVTKGEVQQATGASDEFMIDLINAGLFQIGEMKDGAVELLKEAPGAILVDTVLGTKRFVPVTSGDCDNA